MVKYSIFSYLISILIALSTFSGVLKLPSNIYIVALFLFIFSVIINNKKEKLFIQSKSILFFLLICACSILYNNPPPFFRPWERFLLFCLVLLSFSAIFTSKKLIEERMELFKSLVNLFVVFSIGSFFAFFLGVNYFVRDGVEMDMSEVGHFSGLIKHSMLLGPISAISFIYSFSKCFIDSKIKIKLLWTLIACFTFSACTFSASRASVGGMLVGSLVALYVMCKKRGKNLGKYLGYLVVVVILLSPIIINLMSGVIQKNEGNIEQGGIMYSRETTLLVRIIEIRENFFTGVGFACVDTNLVNVDKETGVIEPGSSWLAAFSMTGILGFALLIFIYVKAIRNAFKNITDPILSMTLSGILVFFGVHMIAEGYVLAGGHVLCCFFWLTMGCINARKTTNQLKCKVL